MCVAESPARRHFTHQVRDPPVSSRVFEATLRWARRHGPTPVPPRTEANPATDPHTSGRQTEFYAIRDI